MKNKSKGIIGVIVLLALIGMVAGANAVISDDLIDTTGQLNVSQSATTGIGARIYRNLAAASTNTWLAKIFIDHTDDDQGALYILTDEDADASNPTVKIQSTSAAHDQAMVEIANAGSGVSLLLSGTTKSISDSTASWTASSLAGFINIGLTGTISGGTTIDASGDLTVATVTMTGFTVDADGDTAVKTLLIGATTVINADLDLVGIVDATISGTFTDGTATLVGGAWSGISTLAMTGALTGATGITATGTTGVAVLTTSGAATLGNGADIITVNAGTAAFALNADSFQIDLDSTVATDTVNIARNVASATQALLELTITATDDTEEALKITQATNSVGILVDNTLDSTASTVAKFTHSSEGAATNYVDMPNGGDSQRRTALFFRNVASGQTGQPMVTMQNANAGDDQSVLFVNDDKTTGATGQSSVRIDSENSDSSALYITSAVDGTGTSAIFDDSALAVVTEGLGGAAYFYSNVAGGTNPLVTISVGNADSTGHALYIVTNEDASASNPAFLVEVTSAAYDQPAAALDNDGAAASLHLSGTTQQITSASNLAIAPTGAVDITGELSVSGVTGAAQVVCVKADGDFGTCTGTFNDGTGTCTCA